MTIQTRVAVGMTAAILITVGTMIAVSSREAFIAAETNGQLEALASARKEAAEVKAEIELALNSARTLAQSLAAARSGGVHLSRDQVSSMLSGVLRENPAFLGVYTAWEPGAFDGRDSEFAGKPPSDSTGRFIPYWSRGGNGAFSVEALTDYESQERGPTGVRKGDYYLCPKDTGRECVLNPFPYEVQGKDVMMTSLVVPVVVDGRFRGIAGIDMALGTLQSRVDGLSLFGGTGRAAIVSANGLLVAAQGRAELIGQSAGQFKSGDGELMIAAPLELGRIQAPWSVRVVMPESVVLASARRAAWMQAIVGIFIAILGVVGVLLLVVRGVNRILLRIVAELREGASQVSDAAMQVAQTSQTLAEGANNQTIALSDTSASTGQLKETARQSSAHAESVAAMTGETVRDVQAANAVLREMEESMSEIEQSSEKISKIIRTIDEIAFQTNILALNAAVEAARAGEAGMGFAVVADEVRNLAQRAARAAQDTSSLIAESIESSKKGSQKVASVVGAIAAVTEHAGRVRGVIAEVSEASREQMGGIDSIAQTVGRLEDIARATAASAEESAAASEELSGLAASVDGIVGRLQALVGSH